MAERTSGCCCGDRCDVAFGFSAGAGAQGGLVEDPATAISARLCGSDGSGNVRQVFPLLTTDGWKNKMWQAVPGGRMCCGMLIDDVYIIFSADCDGQSDCT